MTYKQTITQVKAWEKQGMSAVLVTGVFDLLHIEHLRFLKKAKAAGDKLIVGLETDTRVKVIKGPYRPINPQAVRLEQVTALKAVDLAFILPEKFNTQADWEKLIAAIKPAVYAVSQKTSFIANKRAIVEKFGGSLKIIHRHNPRFSTSLLIARVINPHIGQDKRKYTTPVITGHGRGKKIGYPTLNLVKPNAFPYQHGIYAGWVWFGQHRYPGAFHFGPIPVFNQTAESLEVYVLTPSQLHSPPTSVTIQLLHYLRPIKDFESPKDLTQQIDQDVQLVTTLLNPRRPV